MPDPVRSPNPFARFLWALFLRCPNCGGRPLFDSWLRIKDRCPRCGLRTERGEEGYQVGAYMFNIIMAELIWAAIFVTLIYITWPQPPWNVVLYAGGATMIVMPFLCYPVSKTVFLAFDLLFRPPEDTEDGS
ncbi:MAG TPA: DUF983 domain-containing protein [Gemmatimonadales bacterium]|jgi:uncharacterized protein (DUF983 family)|nr:DUF983 domain-containing protein [Gemmatimonadales bacterium]